MPGTVFAVVEIVSEEEPEFTTEAGVIEAETPEGRVPRLRLTVPVKPFNAARLRAYVVLLPGEITRAVGLALTLKSAVVETVTLSKATSAIAS